MNKDRIAIIDCGTNTFHLLIVDNSDHTLKVIHKERLPVRIGDGGISSGRITPDAADRSLEALRKFAGIISAHRCPNIRAFATSAFRSASNGRDLVSRIANETNIQVRIIDGDEEAGLIFEGVTYALKNINGPALVIDIGGGSVEFIIGHGNRIHWKKSYEIGAQRMMDLFYPTDPIPEESVRAIHKYLDSNLNGLGDAIDKYGPSILIGSSGSFETLGEMHMLEFGVPAISESELPLTLNAFKVFHEKLLTLPRAERRKIPGMIEMRIDMIVVASILIDHVINMMSPAELRVSRYALKEGVLSRWLKEKNLAE